MIGKVGPKGRHLLFLCFRFSILCISVCSWVRKELPYQTFIMFIFNIFFLYIFFWLVLIRWGDGSSNLQSRKGHWLDLACSYLEETKITTTTSSIPLVTYQGIRETHETLSSLLFIAYYFHATGLGTLGTLYDFKCGDGLREQYLLKK